MPSEVASHAPPAGKRDATFVGRRAELAEAAAAWATARTGRGTIFLVSGEAGIGKTRFAEEVAARAQHDGAAVAWGRCWAEGGAPSLWPWHDVLRELCGPEGPALLADDRDQGGSDAARFARFIAVLDALRARCQAAPAVAVLDDVHAADAGALLLARFVARSLHSLPLVVVVTRMAGEPSLGGERARLINDLGREARSVPLRGLDRDETVSFLEALGHVAPDPAEVDRLLRLSGGNPLYLQEAAAAMADRSAVLPDGVVHAVDHRLARLAPETLTVLRYAAVLGTRSTVAEVATLAGVEPAAVVAAGEDAVAHRLVTVDQPGTMAFDQELVRERLVASLDGAARLDAHARAAGLVDDRVGGHDHQARKAHHALAAAPRSTTDARHAIATARATAQAMARASSCEAAAALLDQAIGVAERLLPGERRAELLVERAEVAVALGRLRDARRLAVGAHSVAEAEGTPGRPLALRWPWAGCG